MPLLPEHHAHGSKLPAQDYRTATRQCSGKTGDRVPALHFCFAKRSGRGPWLHITFSSGGEVRDGRAVRQVTPRSFFHEGICRNRRAKQKGAFNSETEKILISSAFSSPGWEVYLTQAQGNSILQIAADRDFNYCWGTVNFLIRQIILEQITFKQGFMFYRREIHIVCAA